MLSALDTDEHTMRLRNLRNDYQNQERFMSRALANLQAELDAWQAGNETLDRQLHNDLKNEQAEQALELDHIRLALAGTSEELASHQLHLRSLADEEQAGFHDNTTDSYELLGA